MFRFAWPSADTVRSGPWQTHVQIGMRTKQKSSVKLTNGATDWARAPWYRLFSLVAEHHH